MSEQNYRKSMHEKKENYADSDFMLVCTSSGRIVHATPLLKAVFGTEVAGKNLNDFLEDNVVSEIVSRAAKGECYLFDCLITGNIYSGISEKEGNAINIYFSEKKDKDNTLVGDNSLKYLQAEINSVLGMLLGALQTVENKNDPAAMFARHNIYRLLRVTRNVFDRAKCENPENNYISENCDILEICKKVADSVKFPLRSVNVEIEVWHDGGRHICYCVAEQIERIISNMLSFALKGGVNNGRTTYLKLDVIEKEQGVLLSVLAPHKLLNETLIAGVFSETDNKASLTDREMRQTLLTIKSLAAYNNGSLVISTEKDGDRLAVLLPKVNNKNALKLESPRVNYSYGIGAALVELSEILPDSLY